MTVVVLTCLVQEQGQTPEAIGQRLGIQPPTSPRPTHRPHPYPRPRRARRNPQPAEQAHQEAVAHQEENQPRDPPGDNEVEQQQYPQAQLSLPHGDQEQEIWVEEDGGVRLDADTNHL
jgi:hypothetical protein